MRAMVLATVNEIVDASEHIPNGASLVVHQVDWDDYERVLEGLAARRTLRIYQNAAFIAMDENRGRLIHVGQGNTVNAELTIIR